MYVHVSLLTTAELIALEQQLLDDEVAGEDTWHERDEVLQELNSRDDWPKSSKAESEIIFSNDCGRDRPLSH